MGRIVKFQCATAIAAVASAVTVLYKSCSEQIDTVIGRDRNQSPRISLNLIGTNFRHSVHLSPRECG